jgi:hypothetical protein
MKATTSITRVIAGGLVFSALMMGSFYGFAQQQRAVLGDPKLGAIQFTDNAGYQIDEAFVQPGEIIQLKLPVINDNHGQAIPAGSCKIKIGLGSKLELDPSFDLNSAALHNYFKWTAGSNSGQIQITGELIAPLPASVKEVNVSFKVKGTLIGKSTITANYLISNHNTQTVMSDEDGSNNASFLPYTVTSRPAPVSVTVINELKKVGCALNITFSSDREVNLARYEVEVSKDGTDFQKMATISAIGNLHYTSSFELPESLQAARIFVRIKQIERTGRSQYTGIENVNGLCKALPIKLSVYPNPVSISNTVTINATQGIFEGRYRIKVMDMGGKAVLLKDFTLNGVQNFALELPVLAAGKYMVQVANFENENIGVVKFEKL